MTVKSTTVSSTAKILGILEVTGSCTSCFQNTLKQCDSLKPLEFNAVYLLFSLLQTLSTLLNIRKKKWRFTVMPSCPSERTAAALVVSSFKILNAWLLLLTMYFLHCSVPSFT